LKENRILLFLEIILMAVMLAWGIQLACPPSTFELSVTSFYYFKMFAPEGAWATAMLSASCFHAIAIVMQIKGKLSTRFRQLPLLAYVGIWIFVALALMAGNIDGTGWLTTLGYAATSAVTYYFVGEQKHGR
jgi:hypothetical protein